MDESEFKAFVSLVTLGLFQGLLLLLEITVYECKV